MSNPDAFDGKRTDLPGFAGGDLVNLRTVFEIMLLQFVRQQAQRQLGAVDRHIKVLQDEGQGADMILMGMGQHDRLELGLLLQQITDVGDHQIDA